VRLRARTFPDVRRRYRRPARGRSRLSSSLQAIREAEGLEAYLDAIEERLARTVASHPGLVAAVGNEALAAGGKRLRPVLVFLSTPPGREPSIAAGVAVELVHMATLVHDDLIDRAHFRRGKAAAWSVYGAEAARATGDYLFARAFAELSATSDVESVQVLADATLALARGEALQRTQTNDPSTTVAAYLERCALKTGALFEAACRLGGGSGEYGIALGVAFQIADDVLDCSGATIETGKIAGTDLRDGTPTLPLLLAAQKDVVVRAALAGGPLDGALVRVAATGALERSREVALDYATRARACLNGELHRDELESLTHAVVNRER
jgi:octaprenyl-diphosphate synthase